MPEDLDRIERATTDLDRLERATAELDPPFAVVDLDAFWANAADMERRAAPKPIRLASKSVRCRALQERVLARPGFAGTLAYTLPEALWLAGRGFEDIVVAYPTADRRALRELALLTAERPGARVTIMVDSLAQLDLLDAATRGVDGGVDRGWGLGEGRASMRLVERAWVRLVERAWMGLEEQASMGRWPARRCASASSSTPASGRSAGGCASAPSAPPCTPPSRSWRSPAPSSRATGCNSSA